MIEQKMIMNQSTCIENLENWVEEWIEDGWKIDNQSITSCYDPNEGDHGAVVSTIMLTVSKYKERT